MIGFTMCNNIQWLHNWQLIKKGSALGVSNNINCMMMWFVAVRGDRYRSKKVVQNRLKCPFCDKTCTCPSNLSVHIRYRHLDSKPFKCSYCEYGWVVSLPSHWATELLGPDDNSGRLFHGFSRLFRQMLGWYLKLGNDNFLADPFHFIGYPSCGSSFSRWIVRSFQIVIKHFQFTIYDQLHISFDSTGNIFTSR
jgi:hypothetical protein